MTVTCLIVKTNCTIVMLNLILKCSNSETQQSKIHYSQNSFPHSLFHKCTPLQCNNRRASLAWNFYLENFTDSYLFLTGFTSVSALLPFPLSITFLTLMHGFWSISLNIDEVLSINQSTTAVIITAGMWLMTTRTVFLTTRKLCWMVTMTTNI